MRNRVRFGSPLARNRWESFSGVSDFDYLSFPISMIQGRHELRLSCGETDTGMPVSVSGLFVRVCQCPVARVASGGSVLFGASVLRQTALGPAAGCGPSFCSRGADAAIRLSAAAFAWGPVRARDLAP